MMYDMVDIPKKTELLTYFPPSCFPLMMEIIFSIFLSKAALFLFDVAATYNAKGDKTVIVVKPEGQKAQTVTKKGIIILELLTGKDGLKYRY